MFGVILLLQYDSFSAKIRTRGYSTSLKNGVVLLLGHGVVNSVQVSKSREGKTPPDLNIPTTMFHCRFDTLRYHSLPSSSPHIHRLVTAINLKLGFISKFDFFPVIHCEMLVFLKVFDFASPPEKWFRNCSSSSETTIRQPSFVSTFADWSLAFFI